MNAPPPFLRRRIGAIDSLLVPRPGSGLVAARLLLRRGSADEGDGEIGVASFCAGMLKRGSLRRDSERVAAELESLGAMTGFDAGPDRCAASIRAAAPEFPAAFDILAECVREPAFDAEQFENERRSVLAALRRVEDDKFGYAFRAYIKRIFAGHGYGHAPEGEISDVERATPERCAEWHGEVWRPENLLLAAAGDFDPDEFAARVEAALGDWRPRGESRPRNSRKVPPPSIASADAIEKPGLEQGFVVAGFLGPEPGHPDQAALRIACAVLGEGFGGRLFSRLRDRRSLAYAVGSFMDASRLGGHTALYIGTNPARLDEAREGLLAEAEELRRERASEDEIERAKNYVVGKYLMARQSLASRAGALASWEDVGLGAEYDAEYPEILKRVEADDVLEAARRWWTHPTVVVLKPESGAEVA